MTISTTTATQRRAASLLREKLELDDRRNIVVKEIEALQDPLLEHFADAGEISKSVATISANPLHDLLRDVLEEGARSLSPELLERISETIEPIRLNLRVSSIIWANAKPGMQEEACAALIANGFAAFVRPTFNVSTLSSRAREMERNGEQWPEAVLEVLSVTPKVQIVGTRT